MPLKISFSTLGCPEWDLETIAARGSDCGYDAVDFRMLAGQMRLWELPEFSSHTAQTKRRLDDAGLAVSAFSSGARMFATDPAARAKHLDEVVRYRRLCEAFGAGYVRVFGGQLEGTDPAEAVKVSIDALERMAAAAGPVCVAVETHDDWVNTALLAEVLAGVTAENVCVLWDLHHPYRLGGESPASSYENIGRYTRYTHVKDSRLGPDGSCEPVLPGGGGDIPLGEMVDLLTAGGYDGYLTLEWEKHWQPDIAPPEQALPAYARLLRQLAGR